MIIDHRTYDIKPGCLPKFLQLYGTEGFPVQLKHLGQPFGYFTVTDIGPLNQVIHMWKYESLADREAKRVRLKHGPIRKLEMPGMTMLFQVADPALLDAVSVGDTVGFKVEQRGQAFVVTEWVREGAK